MLIPAMPSLGNKVISRYLALYFLNPNFQASSFFCGGTALFVSDLVGNPKNRFSRDTAHFTMIVADRRPDQEQEHFPSDYNRVINI